MPRGEHPNSRANLKVPSSKEARKNGSKGGKASAETRAIYKSLTEDLKERCTPERVAKMNDRIIGMAEHGNLRAYELIRSSLGEDPAIEVKRSELELKRAEAERKNPASDTEPTVFELMVKELYEQRSDEEAEVVPD